MKLALFDFHRLKNNKIIETYKIRDALKVRDSIEIDIFEMLGRVVPQVSLEEYNGIVLSGSDSNHLERYPGYRITKVLIEQALKVRIPILGICAGQQILARMLGFSLEFMEDGPEMGWYEIFLSQEGKSDPLFKDIPDTFVSFLCHIKMVNPNSRNDYTILGQNDNCLQAFKFGEGVYGIQFHPEDSIESGEELIKEYKRRPSNIQNAVSTPIHLHCLRIFENFIEIVESQNSSTVR